MAGADDAGPSSTEGVARRLSADAWGGYVALLPDSAMQVWSVFRDPSGALDAITWRRDGVAVVADDLTASPCGLLPADLDLDWRVITEIICRPLATSHLSPLGGVHVVAPGDLQTAGAGADTAQPIWRPARYADPKLAASPAALRQVVLDTVSDLAGVHDALIAEVSGGLDSAIVAGALVATGHRGRVRAGLNFHAPQREGDERAYAEAVCARLDAPLVTRRSFTDLITAHDLAAFAGSAGPAFASVDFARDRHTAAVLREAGARALFGGHGGDAVFFQMPSPTIVGDVVASRGLAAALDPDVVGLARRLRRSVWSVMAGARQAAQAPVGAPPRTARFWGPTARESTPLAPHPWLRDLDGLHPAKQLQLQYLTTSQGATRRCARGGVGPLVRPLLAQPVLEAWLPTPAAQLAAGGGERGLARQLFGDLVPEVVVQRRSKGALTSAYTRGMAASLDVMRPHLLDGALVRAGLLDRDAVDAALQPDRLIRDNAGVRLIRAALIESWVRHWQARTRDRREPDR